MKEMVGLMLIIAGIIFGVWAGVWWAFIGGIIDVVQAFKATDISAGAVAIGVAKVFFAGAIGWIAGAVAVFPGWLMLNGD